MSKPSSICGMTFSSVQRSASVSWLKSMSATASRIRQHLLDGVVIGVGVQLVDELEPRARPVAVDVRLIALLAAAHPFSERLERVRALAVRVARIAEVVLV